MSLSQSQYDADVQATVDSYKEQHRKRRESIVEDWRFFRKEGMNAAAAALLAVATQIGHLDSTISERSY